MLGHNAITLISFKVPPRPSLCCLDSFAYPHLCSTSLEGVPGSPGKSQEEGQEDHGEVE